MNRRRHLLYVLPCVLLLVATALGGTAKAAPEMGGGTANIDVVPSDNLPDPASVTVTTGSSGYDTDGQIYECLGTTVQNATACKSVGTWVATTHSTGVTVTRVWAGKDGDCGSQLCGILVRNNGFTAFHHLTFAPASTTTTTTAPPATTTTTPGGGSTNVGLPVQPVVRSVTVSPNAVTYGTCTKGGASLTFPNDSCSTPAVTVTNTGIAGNVNVHGADLVPTDNGTHWALCQSACAQPGQDQFAQTTSASGATTQLANTDACDTAFNQGACTAATNQSTAETISLVGPSSSTDSSTQFNTAVTWTAVP